MVSTQLSQEFLWFSCDLNVFSVPNVFCCAIYEGTELTVPSWYTVLHSTCTFYTDMENTNPLNTSTSDDVIDTNMQKWMATAQHNWHQKFRGFPIPFVQSSWLVNLLHECPCCHRTMTSLGRRNTGIASSSREEVSSSSGTELTSRCRYVPTKLIGMEMRRTFSAIAQSSR